MRNSIGSFFSKIFFGPEGLRHRDSEVTPVLNDFTLEAVVDYIKANNVKHIITMAGAGISTSAGIPDFRSPNTGLYDNLSEYGLNNPMDIFTLSYFKENPKPFFSLAKKLYKPDSKPTFCHYFIRMLHEKKLLLRHYTQNVDDLERKSGLPEEKFVEAHGTFHTGKCMECNTSYSFEYMEEHIMNDVVPKCCQSMCTGVVKPDIVFFGEGLPSRFHNLISRDFQKCDLLIIMGTSLSVMPFGSLIHKVGRSIPRLYLNLTYSNGTTTGINGFLMRAYVGVLRTNSMLYGEESNVRDVFHECEVDDGCMEFAKLLGIEEDIINLQKLNNAKLSAEKGQRDNVKANKGRLSGSILDIKRISLNSGKGKDYRETKNEANNKSVEKMEELPPLATNSYPDNTKCREPIGMEVDLKEKAMSNVSM